MKNGIYTDRNSTSNSTSSYIFYFPQAEKDRTQSLCSTYKVYVYFILECINFHRQKTNLMKRKPHSEQKRKHQRKETFCVQRCEGTDVNVQPDDS